NPTPRVAETSSGMLNAIGLQNPGVNKIIESEIPFLADYDTCIIANVAGSSVEEYKIIAQAFNHTDNVDALELNISSPNLNVVCIQFRTDSNMAAHIT